MLLMTYYEQSISLLHITITLGVIGRRLVELHQAYRHPNRLRAGFRPEQLAP